MKQLIHNSKELTASLKHPITKEVAIRDEYYKCRAVSDWNGGYYIYSEKQIFAYWFNEWEQD